MPKSTKQLVRRGKHAARRFGGDQRLKVQDIDQARFDELRLRQRRGHAQDRLGGKECGAFRHGVHVAGEAERGEIVEKLLAKAAGTLKPRQVGVGKAQRLQIIERLLETRGQQKSAPCRQSAGKEFEYRGLGIAMVQIGLDHVDLIKVRQQRTGIFHRGRRRRLANHLR